MRIRLAVPEEHVQPDVLNAALEAVTRLDEHMIRSGQSPTSSELIANGARWHPEPPGDEHFDHGGTIALRGHGDCDDWAPLHAASLRASGEDSGAHAIVVPSGPNIWHALVKRSDGSTDDPSIAAGMPPPKRSVVGGEPHMQVHCCDDQGRIFQGSLAPTVGPLTMHCGPQFAVRGLDIVGMGRMYQARCDMPLQGSPLLQVHRHLPGRHAVVGGHLPYALSCTSLAPTPDVALGNAIMGALMCGDAAEIMPNLDRYKLIAIQMGIAGHSASETRKAIEDMVAADLEMAEAHTGIPAAAHAHKLKQELAAHGFHITGASGYMIDGYIVGGFFDDVANIANGVIHTVQDGVDAVGKFLTNIPWGDIVHGIEAAVSIIPGIGTAISEVLAAAETAINAIDAAISGNPLKFALQTALNFGLAAIPGGGTIRILIDTAVKKLFEYAEQKLIPNSDELNKMLDGIADEPKIGDVSPRSIVATLVHILVGHLGVKNTSGGPAAKPKVPFALDTSWKGATYVDPAVQAAAAQQRKSASAPVQATPARKPLGVPHAAVHVNIAAKPIAAKPVRAAPRGVFSHKAGTPHVVMPPSAAPYVAPAPFVATAPDPSTHVTTPTMSFHWHCQPPGRGSNVWSCQWVAA